MSHDDINAKVEQIANTIFRQAVKLDRRAGVVVGGLVGALCWVAKRYGVTEAQVVARIQQTWQLIPDRSPVVPFRQVSQDELDQLLIDNGMPPMGPIKTGDS